MLGTRTSWDVDLSVGPQQHVRAVLDGARGDMGVSLLGGLVRMGLGLESVSGRG